MGGVERLDHLLRRAGERLGELVDGRRATELRRQAFGLAAHRQRPLLEVARDVHAPSLVAEMALELAHDRRRGVARELLAELGLESIERVQQAERCDLNKVVERLATVDVAERQLRANGMNV